MTDHASHNETGSPETTSIIRWRCPNCGQTIFTAPDFEPPDICAYCRDMTTWQRIPEPNHSQNNTQ